MRRLFLIAFFPALASAATTCKGIPSLRYHGDFGPVSSTGAECDKVFAVTNYVVQHVVAGSTGTISVLSFRTATSGAALHNVTFTGLVGPDCDFGNNEKKVAIGGQTFEASATGLVARDILVAEVTAVLFRNGTEVCRTRAEFTGFPGTF